MWNIVNPGENVALGATVRFLPSNDNSKVYQVFKTELHYFEVVVKSEHENFMENPVRRIIRYMDIGYHIGMEVWIESSQAKIIDLYEDVSKQNLEPTYVSSSY